VHADRSIVLAGERVAFRREIDIARRFRGDRSAVVGGEHPAEEAHGASIPSRRLLRQRLPELDGVRFAELVERDLVVRPRIRLCERSPRLPEIRIDRDRALQ
jgi:hypothetical protein